MGGRGPEPSGRFAQAASVEGNQLFVVGGCNADSRPLNDVHVLTVALPLPSLACSKSAVANLPAASRQVPSRTNPVVAQPPAKIPGGPPSRSQYIPSAVRYVEPAHSSVCGPKCQIEWKFSHICIPICPALWTTNHIQATSRQYQSRFRESLLHDTLIFWLHPRPDTPRSALDHF